MQDILRKISIFILFGLGILLSPLLIKIDAQTITSHQKTETASPIQHVFIILMENHNWSDIKGSSSAPYINKTLLPMGAHAEQYFNPPGNHPSLPNYLWLETGTNFGIQNDNGPYANHQGTTQHLVTLLQKKGLTWKAYEEDITGKTCPLNSTGNYAVKHDPFVYFDDVTNNLNPSSQNCIKHIRPFTQLATDLKNNTVAHYNFITPNVIDDMHNGTIQQGDTWLKNNLPAILNSKAYKTGVIFITWDEGEGGDGPIGMIVLSPFAKKNYSNSIHYDHSSTLKTIEEIFGVTPLLGGAARATDLSNLFTVQINGTDSQVIPSGISDASTVSGIPSPEASQSPCSAPSQVTSTGEAIYAPKKHHQHINGLLSNLIHLLLYLIINLTNQLIGGNIPQVPNPDMSPCINPSP